MGLLHRRPGGAAVNSESSVPDRRAPVRFALTYALVSAVLFIAYFVFTFPYSGLPYRIFTRYLHGYAVVAGAVLHVFDPVVSVSENNIVGRTSLAIVRGCDGTEMLILFAAAVIASRPRPWRLRALGVIAGAAALSAANVARICSLYYVAIRSPSAMEFWHLELWPLILIAMAVGLFVGWDRWAASKEEARVR
jgi:exosortase/archaeosortase family protein